MSDLNLNNLEQEMGRLHRGYGVVQVLQALADYCAYMDSYSEDLQIAAMYCQQKEALLRCIAELTAE